MPKVYTGAGQVSAADTRYVKWVGKTKGGKSIQIEMEKAFCRSNPDWKFEDKNETTPELEFEGLYDDTKLATDDRTEPWKITLPDDLKEGVDEIILGVGRFYIGKTSADAKPVALTRGGGSFIVEREYRDIAADGDPGSVEGRIAQDSGRPKLKLTALQWISRVAEIYPGLKEAATT